jgi:hypothetical protein
MTSDPEWLVTARERGLVIREGQPMSSALALPAPTAEVQVAEVKPARTPRPTPLAPETPLRGRLVIELDIPIRLASEANQGGKLGAKIGRKSAVKTAVKAALPRLVDPFPLPVTVTITRLGGKQLDIDDNLPRSCKAVKDVLAEFLGVQDHGRDPRVKWRFRQRPAWSSGVRIRVAFGGG